RLTERLSVGLEHASWDVRALAARLLGESGGDAARAPLEDRLARESDDLVRGAIREALEDLGEGT
ncbi:MAG: HEAT repeat domain-containing protein, partial [Polyangiales bacterium]